jgi:translation initiation factor 2B subunit (eIF-2B alpha/beta/delta family)
MEKAMASLVDLNRKNTRVKNMRYSLMNNIGKFKRMESLRARTFKRLDTEVNLSNNESDKLVAILRLTDKEMRKIQKNIVSKAETIKKVEKRIRLLKTKAIVNMAKAKTTQAKKKTMINRIKNLFKK